MVAAVSAAGRMLGQFRVTLPVGVMILALDPESESDFQPFADSDPVKSRIVTPLIS